VIEKPQETIEENDTIEEITQEVTKQAPIAEINDQPKTEKKSIWNKITSIFKKKDKN